MQIGLLLFPNLTQLDLTGPFEVFARMRGAQVHLIWKTTELVTCDRGLTMRPSVDFAHCPPLDVICVPGGPGQIDLMDDEETLPFCGGRRRRRNGSPPSAPAHWCWAPPVC